MQHEIRLASFNVRNLALPGLRYYENMPPYSAAEYDMKTAWIARQLDQSNADVIGLQEIFSPEALENVLAKTQHYRSAHYITVETGSDDLPHSPNVALVSRLPIVGSPVFHHILPGQLKVALPGDNIEVSHFSRPVLHATLQLLGNIHAHILLAHLKSKIPDYPDNADADAPLMPELGSLRSLIRRGTDALGIRHLLTHLRALDTTPVFVMGDLNDFAFATSTQIIMGDPHHVATAQTNQLYNCFDIQPGLSFDEKNSAFIRGSEIPRIDHILVTEEFTAQSGFRMGTVKNARYFSSHLGKDRPEISDHGLLMVTIGLK